MRKMIANIHRRCRDNRFLWFMTSLLIYSIILSQAAGILGPVTASFSLLPASVAAFLYGSWAGVVSTTLLFFYNYLLLHILLVDGPEIINISFIIGHTLVMMISYVVGLFNELRIKLGNEIEERKEAEAKLAYANERLSGEAERAAQARSFFLSAISHELRTPMNAVMGMTDLILDTPLKPDQLEYAQMTKRNGQATLDIIDNILDFTKIESGALQLEQKPMNLHRCINEVLKQLAEYATHKKVQLISDIHADVSVGQIGDKERLQQILHNLVDNAIKFTKDGEVRVMVRLEALSDGETSILQFAVQDNGSGIRSADLQHLFEPFIQDDLSSTRKYGGTGLGLTICRSLVERMGGTIWAESQWGSGSTFYFRIKNSPCTMETPTSPPEDRTEPMTNDELAQLYPLKILLVEDNRVNQKVAQRILQRLGYQIDVVDDGLQAVEQIAANQNGHQPYDLILMDIQMPVMDGAEATIRIRELGSQISQPYIIALTADVLWEDRTYYIGNGMNDYVGKPIALKQISTALAKASVALEHSVNGRRA